MVCWLFRPNKTDFWLAIYHFGTLVQAGQAFQVPLFGTQNSTALEVKCSESRSTHYPGTHFGSGLSNLLSLIAETSSHRSKLHYVPDAPLVRHDYLYSQMTDGPNIQDTNRDRAVISSALMAAHQVGLFRV
jgi:hypothetical protein